jgi:hypothetical protein
MYVIYKENFIPSVGAVHPQGIELGLGSYKGWNLANCPESKIHSYTEFEFIAVNTQVARGIQILDSLIDMTSGIPTDADIEADEQLIVDDVTKVTLSEQDELDVEVAKTFINNLELKLVTRAKVREMKDVEDDLVDIKRLVQTLITFTVDDWMNKPESEKAASKYKKVMDSLSGAIAENIGALSTIDKDLDKINAIVDMEVEIAKVVDEYYLTKKL